MTPGSTWVRQDACSDIDLSRIPRFREQVELVPVGGDAVLYDESSGEMYELDRIAAQICRMIDGRTSIGAAVELLAGTFDAPGELIEVDALAMVRNLCRMGLLARPDG